ncbi:MAG: aminotransferase class III-fold pyridoxal phosphate-dependent enzyme [Aureliella sp.]
MGLIAEKFRNDPRVAEARRLLKEALLDAQSQLEGPHGPSPELVAPYSKLLERLAAARGGATYFPYLSSGLGNGPLVELADGSVKFDFITGIGVHGLGHSHPEMLEASLDAALEDAIMQGNLQQHPPALRVCERMLELANRRGATLGHCLLSTSGAMSNENALKIAFHNRQPADRLFALDNCFAGRTIATAQLTDRPQYRQGIPTALAVDYLPMITTQSSSAEIEAGVSVMRKMLARYPGKYAAVWLELIAGEGGYYPAHPDYVRALCTAAREAGVLVIFDEIQTFARLSQPFAFQHFGFNQFADIVTFGKITQVCGTLYRHELKPKGPLLSQTFIAATSSIAAALRMLDMLEKVGCFGEASENIRRHQVFESRMQELAKRYPGQVSGPYGCGMMFAFTPADGSEQLATRMVNMLYEAGLMSFLAGHDPARIRFLPPPGITTDADINKACDIIESVVARF